MGSKPAPSSIPLEKLYSVHFGEDEWRPALDGGVALAPDEQVYFLVDCPDPHMTITSPRGTRTVPLYLATKEKHLE